MLDCNEWYNLRDDRTLRYSYSGFEKYSVGVIVDSRVAEDYSVQIMTITTTNILARWCRRVKIQLPSIDFPSILNYKKGCSFRDIIIESMREADPCGEFSLGEVNENNQDEILIIGKSDNIFKKPHISISGFGWLAGISYGHPDIAFSSSQFNNPVGPLFASCLGNAELFKYAIEQKRPNLYLKWLSLYEFKNTTENYKILANPEYNPEYDFGRIYQIGCGAVGSCLDFFLSLTHWKFEIYLIDFDKVIFTDCNRTLIFNYNNATKSESKVKVCADILKQSKIEPIVFESSYSDFINKRKYLGYPPDIILCLANEQNIWSTIQNNYPPLVLHATTTKSWGVNFGRHIPKKEWCILCRFSDEINNNFIPLCSEGKVNTDCSEGKVNTDTENQKEVLAVLPFLSPAGAIMILAEMAKMSFNNYPVNNDSIDFSMRPFGGGEFCQIDRGSREDCVCNEQKKLNVYPKEIRNSKFWKLVGE